MSGIDLKSSALNYARSGLKTFPLKPGTKKGQVLKSWKNEATTNIETIETWWNENPCYNIGIATGIQPNGQILLVIDIDKNHSKNVDGEQSFYDNGGENLPNTLVAITPNGGEHYYYYVDKEYKNKVNLYPGIDVRCQNGYIVAPPSFIPDSINKNYKVMNNSLIADADDNVYKFLKGLKESQEDKPSQSNDVAVIDNKIDNGVRNDTLFKLACLLQSKGCTDKNILSMVWSENLQRCVEPLEKEEVKQIVDSALKYKKGQKKDFPSTPLEKSKSMYIYNTPTTGDIINENMENSNNKNDDLSMLNLADVEPKEAKWLIKDFIPLEGITLLIGDGGVGKTFVWCDILSSLSNGTWTFFEDKNYFDLHPRKPMKVMYFSSEDDTEVILQPRLSNMKADMSNIYTIEMKDERLLKITYDSELLKKLVDEIRPGLIVFDPLQSFVPDNVQMSSKNQMRRLLNHLNVICKQYHTTIVIVMHTNKREKAWGRNRASDTGDIWDIARSAFILGKTNDNPRTRYFSHEKSNYGIEQDTTLFEIADDGCVINVGTTTLKDKDFVLGNIYENKNKQPRAEAKEFILEYLNENNKRASRGDVMDYVLACGINRSAFDRAISELKKNKKIKVLPSNDPNKKNNSKDYALLDVN